MYLTKKIHSLIWFAWNLILKRILSFSIYIKPSIGQQFKSKLEFYFKCLHRTALYDIYDNECHSALVVLWTVNRIKWYVFNTNTYKNIQQWEKSNVWWCLFDFFVTVWLCVRVFRTDWRFTMKVVRTYISMFSAKYALHTQLQPNQLTQLHEIKTIKVKMTTHSCWCTVVLSIRSRQNRANFVKVKNNFILKYFKIIETDSRYFNIYKGQNRILYRIFILLENN